MSYIHGLSGLPLYFMNLYQKRKHKHQSNNNKSHNTNNSNTTTSDPIKDNNSSENKENSSSIVFTFPSAGSDSQPDSKVDDMKSKKNSSSSSAAAGLQAINQLLLSVVGQPRSNFATKTNPITEDYSISQNVLGLGINGKVVEVVNKKDGDKCALKVLKDNAKSRREVELHWRSSSCKHIVNIRDVYENVQKGQKCLLVVMELYAISNLNLFGYSGT